jgi:hypothetical protein
MHFEKKRGEAIKVPIFQPLVRDARKVNSRFYRSKSINTDEQEADDNATADFAATAIKVRL